MYFNRPLAKVSLITPQLLCKEATLRRYPAQHNRCSPSLSSSFRTHLPSLESAAGAQHTISKRLPCPKAMGAFTFKGTRFMTTQASPQHPPPLCFYYHGKPLHVLHHDGQWWLHSGDVLAVIGRRLGQRLQHLLAADTTLQNTPATEVTNEYWPATALLRALRRSGKPQARQLRDCVNRHAKLSRFPG